MKSLYFYLKLHPKIAILIFAFLLAGVIGVGWTIKSISNDWAELNQARNETGPPAAAATSLQPVKAVSADPRVNEIMTKYHLGLKAAGYIAQAKLQVLGQTDTSIHFVLTFPDKVTIDETATVAADPSYAPSPADLEKTARNGSSVHGPKLTLKRDGPTKWSYTLQYHLPYSAMPEELRQKIQPPASRASANRFFDLVPAARAEGEEATGEGVISVIANYTAEAYKDIDFKNIKSYSELELEGIDNAKSLGADVPLALIDFLEDAGQMKGWMDEIGKMEDCAKNPTNPLSQKASQDPNYQHDVMDQLSDAKGDVESTALPSLASDAANYMSHFLPFGSGVVVGLIFSTQDEAVSQYAEGRIDEANKYIVPCENPPMTPGDFRPLKGTFEYKYNRSTKTCINEQAQGGCGFRDDTRMAQGKFLLTPEPTSGLMNGNGAGTVEVRVGSHVDKTEASGNSTIKGPVEADVQCGGTPQAGVIRLSIHGDSLKYDIEGTGPSGVPTTPQHLDTGAFAVSCEFKNVDLIKGGGYSANTKEDNGYGTCTIELERQ